MRPIGGYFELELQQREEYHKNANRLNSGKNCLYLILKNRKFKKVFVPYYTCSIVLKPFEELGIAYEFYHINEQFEIAKTLQLNNKEAILYTNYFGLKQEYVKDLARLYRGQLIVDNTQAFFAEPINGIDTLYTCRKFFGVPDGAYLYADGIQANETERSVSYDRVSHLIKRIDKSPEFGFNDYHENEDALGNEPPMLMSSFSQRVMQSIDYDAVVERRRENFEYLNSILDKTNTLKLDYGVDTVPMVYPYLPKNNGLREKLIADKVFVARYWPNVLEWTDESSLDYQFAQNLLPLPIDQRYDKEDMKRIVEIINQ